MTAPCRSALQKEPSKLSRFSGRPVATGPDGKPLWWHKMQEKNDGLATN